MDNLNVIIPMAGLGNRFSKAGFQNIKPLIKVQNKTFIEWSTNTLNIDGNYIFIILEQHSEQLTPHLKQLKPHCTIIEIPFVTQGCAETCLFAKQFINNDNPLIITNCDQILHYDSQKYIDFLKQTDPDGNVMTFYSNTDKNSYAIIDENGWCTKVAEKQVISEHSLVGVHYWKHGSDFVASAHQLIQNDIRANNEYYISLTYNIMIQQHKKINIYPLSANEQYLSIGTPEQLYDYLDLQNDSFQLHDISDMVRGWFIGNFDPCVYKTSDYEVGYLKHKKGERWPFHYHEQSTEINFLVKGEMRLNNKHIKQGQIFVFKPYQIATPEFLEDCEIVCVKTKSAPGDKVII